MKEGVRKEADNVRVASLPLPVRPLSAEEVPAGGFDDGTGSAAAEEPGDGRQYADFGDGGVCA